MLSYIKENSDWIIPLVITTIIAIANLIIAVSNRNNSQNLYKMQNDMFCFQLYSKRFATYESIKEVLSNIISKGDANNDDIFLFLSKTKEVKLLFGDDIVHICEAIHRTIVQLHVVNERIDHNATMNITGENHNKLCDKDAELLNNLTDLSSAFDEKIKEYISFDKYKVSK